MKVNLSNRITGSAVAALPVLFPFWSAILKDE